MVKGEKEIEYSIFFPKKKKKKMDGVKSNLFKGLLLGIEQTYFQVVPTKTKGDLIIDGFTDTRK